MWGRKLLINTILKEKLIERAIPELGPIVTANSFQAVGMLIVQPQSQATKSVQTHHPCFSRRKPKSNENSHQ
jgi:hypothetical protein